MQVIIAMVTDKQNESDAIINRLEKEFGYPRETIRQEILISFGPRRYRPDYVIYDEGKPSLIIETKKRYKNQLEIENQLAAMMKASGANYGVIMDSLGDIVACYKLTGDEMSSTTKIPTIPSYGKKLEELGSHSREDLTATPDLTEVLTRALWEIADRHRSSPFDNGYLILDFAKIVAAKVYDEINGNQNKIGFKADITERPKHVKNNIEIILSFLNRQISISPELSRLSDDEVKQLVIRLQDYDFIKSNIHQIGLKPFLATNSTFITSPINLGSLLVRLLDVRPGQQILDPACGAGQFLAEAGKAGAAVAGIDISRIAIELAGINLYLCNVKERILCQEDSLKQLNELNRCTQQINNARFDGVITQPPFGLRIDDERLYNYRFRRPSWESSEVLFIQQCLNFLKEGGKLAIVVPNSLLFNAYNTKLREYIATNFSIDAVIHLEQGFFLPHTNIATSILLITKMQKDEPKTNRVFFARLKRDKHRNDSPRSFKSRPQLTEKEFDEILMAFVKYLETGKAHETESWEIIAASLSKEYRLDFQFYTGYLTIKSEFSQYFLSEIVEFQLGIKVEKAAKGGSEAKLVRGQHIKDFVVDIASGLPVKIDRELNYKYIAGYGDLLMTRAGNPGNVGIIPNEDALCIASDNLIIIRPNRKLIDPYYLLSFLASEQGQEYLRTLASGSVIMSISLQSLGRLTVPVPDIQTQKEISQKIHDFITLKQKVRQIEEQAMHAKTAINDQVGELFERRFD